MAEGYQYSRNIHIGEGVYDYEVDNLPPRFRKMYEKLKRRLYGEVEQLKYDLISKFLENNNLHDSKIIVTSQLKEIENNHLSEPKLHYSKINSALNTQNKSTNNAILEKNVQNNDLKSERKPYWKSQHEFHSKDEQVHTSYGDEFKFLIPPPHAAHINPQASGPHPKSPSGPGTSSQSKFSTQNRKNICSTEFNSTGKIKVGNSTRTLLNGETDFGLIKQTNSENLHACSSISNLAPCENIVSDVVSEENVGIENKIKSLLKMTANSDDGSTDSNATTRLYPTKNSDKKQNDVGFPHFKQTQVYNQCTKNNKTYHSMPSNIKVNPNDKRKNNYNFKGSKLSHENLEDEKVTSISVQRKNQRDSKEEFKQGSIFTDAQNSNIKVTSCDKKKNNTHFKTEKIPEFFNNYLPDKDETFVCVQPKSRSDSQENCKQDVVAGSQNSNIKVTAHGNSKNSSCFKEQALPEHCQNNVPGEKVTSVCVQPRSQINSHVFKKDKSVTCAQNSNVKVTPHDNSKNNFAVKEQIMPEFCHNNLPEKKVTSMCVQPRNQIDSQNVFEKDNSVTCAQKFTPRSKRKNNSSYKKRSPHELCLSNFRDEQGPTCVQPKNQRSPQEDFKPNKSVTNAQNTTAKDNRLKNKPNDVNLKTKDEPFRKDISTERTCSSYSNHKKTPYAQSGKERIVQSNKNIDKGTSNSYKNQSNFDLNKTNYEKVDSKHRLDEFNRKETFRNSKRNHSYDSIKTCTGANTASGNIATDLAGECNKGLTKQLSIENSCIKPFEKSYKPILEIIQRKEQDNKNLMQEKDVSIDNSSVKPIEESYKPVSERIQKKKIENEDQIHEKDNTSLKTKIFSKKQGEDVQYLIEPTLMESEISMAEEVRTFHLQVFVTEDVDNIEYWKKYLETFVHHGRFKIRNICNFTMSFIVCFETKEEASRARVSILKGKFKAKLKDSRYANTVLSMEFAKMPNNDPKQKILDECLNHIEKVYNQYIYEHNKKILAKEQELQLDIQGKSAVFEKLHSLRKMKCVFQAYVDQIKKSVLSLKDSEGESKMAQLTQIKTSFHRECNSFCRCLPVYSEKDEILKTIKKHQVSIVVAETGSGKSTELVSYCLQAGYANDGLIICTQPRKIAVLSIAEYVSGQLGSPVGSVIGYEAGTIQKTSELTSILFMTEFSFLRRCVEQPNLDGISCIIVDEAHERTLYTDILLGIVKSRMRLYPKLRIVITSATIDPTIFKNYFNLKPDAVLNIAGQIYPVEEVWLSENVAVGWNYVEKCVQTAIEIHLTDGKGDVLVFLTSPGETEDAMYLFRKMIAGKESASIQAKVFCLHGKMDAVEQIEIFKPSPERCRKIIFATNSAETSVTIPGVKYVIDSGMIKEKRFCAHRNKNLLSVTFTSKSSAKQRRGRAGRNQPGICYRMYSKHNYETMSDQTQPEILKTNFQLALLKILEFGYKPNNFDFIEKPSDVLISNSWDSLERIGAIKNEKLTDLGKKIVHLSLEPCLSKLIVEGISANIGYETVIIAALLSLSGKIFYRSTTNKALADDEKIKFCKEEGDICTFLDVFKQWKEVEQNERMQWCINHFISFKSMITASNIVNDIICTFRKELRISIPCTFRDTIFKNKYETILFDCYSENLCIFSGHAKSGYVSPFLTESYFIHPSSSLSYIGCDAPLFILYGTVIETSRNFLLDVTPIKEETITKAYQRGFFNLQVDMLKSLQVVPKIIRPIGENVLINHILGKKGSKIIDLEFQIQKTCKIKTSFHIEVVVDKGQIVIYTEERFHKRVVELINSAIEQSHLEMDNDEIIHKINNSSSYFGIGSGAIVSDIIMPGEYKEIVFEAMNLSFDFSSLLLEIKKHGSVHSVQEIVKNRNKNIHVTFYKVASAEAALFDLKQTKKFRITSKILCDSLKTSAMIYRIKLNWCRIPCKGNGWIEFYNFEDCILASGALTTNPILIFDNFVKFTPAKHNGKELYMTNLPPTADEATIKSKLQKHLHLNLKTVVLVREKIVKVSEGDVTSAKKELFNLFHKFSPPSKFIIDVQCPSSNDIFWNAFVHFEILEDGEKAFLELDGRAKIGSHALNMEPILKSSLYCRTEIFKILKKEMHQLVLKFKTNKICTHFDIKHSSAKDNTIVLTFSCNDIKGLNTLSQRLMKMIQGYSLPLDEKFNILRTKSGQMLLENLEVKWNILISVNSKLKIVNFYGPERNCSIAKEKILEFVNNSNPIKRKVFDLKGIHTPSGFLKSLYERYGYDLEELINSYDLTFASINIHKNQRILTIEGTQVNINQAEQCLENMCADLFTNKSKDDTNIDMEICAICFDSVVSDYQRLDHCGHPFCKSCLLLQLESKIIPVTCVKEGCEKPVFIKDIARILSYGTQKLKESFYAAALQYFVQNNKDFIRYCPSPDCQMIYRLSKSIIKVTCVGCSNDICSVCNVLYHHGMNCDMYQNSQADEDYSLKVWLKEDELNRKICPKCQTVIEKTGGCNHVECAICKTHLCWLCLMSFPSSKMVYSHLPFCPQNIVKQS